MKGIDKVMHKLRDLKSVATDGIVTGDEDLRELG